MQYQPFFFFWLLYIQVSSFHHGIRVILFSRFWRLTYPGLISETRDHELYMNFNFIYLLAYIMVFHMKYDFEKKVTYLQYKKNTLLNVQIPNLQYIQISWLDVLEIVIYHSWQIEGQKRRYMMALILFIEEVSHPGTIWLLTLRL